MTRLLPLSILSLALAAGAADAAEYPVGEAQLRHGMEIAAVYLQPIEMEPAGMMALGAETDIHLEADVRATADNRHGFAEGDWIPNLKIDYRLTKDDGHEVAGTFMAMVASDGPHYGDNVKLSGPGKYRLQFTIAPDQHFGRHVDKETGVPAWPASFTVEYDFIFAGIGKKGAY